MPKQIDQQAVSNAQATYNAHMAEGLTHKQAISATSKALDISRRRINDWANNFDWEAHAPVSEAAENRQLAETIDASETVLENAKRVRELQTAGEIPEGTTQKIIAGETTARKVLNEYDRKVQEQKPYSEREHKITVSVTNAELDNYLAVRDDSDANDDELVKATLKFWLEMQKKGESR